MAKRRKRKKQKGPIRRLLGGLLSLIDWICESLSALLVGLIGGVLKGIGWLLYGLGQLMLAIIRGILFVPIWLARRLTAGGNTAQRCLRLDGKEFEEYVAQVLRDNGYRHVEVTRYSGDQGIDILAERGGKTYGIQCKNYVNAVGNAAVQEAYAGAQYYDCEIAVVVCPGEFTNAAKTLAASTGVQLWDGQKLTRMMKVSGRRPHHRENS